MNIIKKEVKQRNSHLTFKIILIEMFFKWKNDIQRKEQAESCSLSIVYVLPGENKIERIHKNAHNHYIQSFNVANSKGKYLCTVKLYNHD